FWETKKKIQNFIFFPPNHTGWGPPPAPQLSFGFYFLTSLATASPKDKGGVQNTFIFRVLITNRLG
ncbi:MAG: hypothetical protein ACK6CP_12990, partial [Pseudanabaena sp.]